MAQPVVVPPTSVPVLAQGPKVLLLGGGGTGKSHSLGTIMEVAGMQVACIMTEPSGIETLENTDPERFHWKYVAPAVADWPMLQNAAKIINTMSYESLTKMGDIDKRKFTQWYDFLGACANFTCDRCGKNLGPIDKLPSNFVVAVDSLSGLNEMAMNMVVGMKPVRHQGDWGVAMNNLEKFIITLSTGIPTMVVLTGHTEKELDEINGGLSITASSLGKKLGPKIGKYFSDVIMTKRDGTTFSWTTAAIGADVKARNVPISDKIPPTFVPIIEKWHKRINFKP